MPWGGEKRWTLLHVEQSGIVKVSHLKNGRSWNQTNGGERWERGGVIAKQECENKQVSIGADGNTGARLGRSKNNNRILTLWVFLSALCRSKADSVQSHFGFQSSASLHLSFITGLDLQMKKLLAVPSISCSEHMITTSSVLMDDLLDFILPNAACLPTLQREDRLLVHPDVTTGGLQPLQLIPDQIPDLLWRSQDSTCGWSHADPPTASPHD